MSSTIRLDRLSISYGRILLAEECKYLLGVLTVDRAGATYLTGSARQQEARSFDQDGAEQRMHDPHVVAAVRKLGIGQAFRTVLHLVGRDAESLQLVLERQGVAGFGASRDDLVEFIVALVALVQRERGEVGALEPRRESPPVTVGRARDCDPCVGPGGWKRAMRRHRGVTVPAQSKRSAVHLG